MPYKDHEKRLESHRKTHAKRRSNPEVRAVEVQKCKEWRQANPERVKDLRKKAELAKKGWTPEMVERTSLEQGGRCMICRQTPKTLGPQGGTGGLVPDHRHAEPPEPRALLCHKCNSLIGFAKDDPAICRAAAEYLEAWTV
jgi:hypothetical protein